MDPTTLHAAVRRFPLVGRPRPACLPLHERVREVTEIAGTARRQGADAMHEAAHALNKAALLASDCGLPELAHSLCWKHIDLYRAAGPRLTVLQARYMLEPALNLARLRIRADDGDRALRLLDTMDKAVTARTDLVVDGRTLPLAQLTGTPREHHKLREWVWLQYLADGIRALALAGRWDEAVTHARAHRGVARHLMEGRQAAIISHCLRGTPRVARAVLEESTPTQPWEHQVAACLRVMCAEPDEAATGRHMAAMVERFLRHEPVPGYAVFRARLGLTVAALAGGADAGVADCVRARVATEVIESGDGYAARDVLAHQRSSRGLSDARRQALAALVASSGLGAGALPEPLLGTLMGAVETAGEALATALRSGG